MDGPAQQPSLPEIVASIEGRTAVETQHLVGMLEAWCWPGGADRSERAALEWVKRWGPSRITAQPFECSCVQGRCTVCN